MIRKIIGGVVLGCATFCIAEIRLLVVDTQGKDPYYYRNLLVLAKSAGFQVSYRNLYDLLENPAIDKYDALFFMISPAMLSQKIPSTLYCRLPKKAGSALHEQCLHSLISFCQQTGKGIGLILPTIHYSSAFLPLLEKNIAALTHLSKVPEATHTTISSYLASLSQPDSKKGSHFGTGILNKSDQTFSTLAKETSSTKYLPLHKDRYTTQAQQTFPMALIFHNPSNENIFLISRSSEFDFADFAEHFFKNPFALNDRNELLKAAQEALQAFYLAVKEKKIQENIPSISLPTLFDKKQLTTTHRIIAQNRKSNLFGDNAWLKQKAISCAWFDPYDCFAHEDKHQKIKEVTQKDKEGVEDTALHRGIKILHDGNFSIVWFEFIPEWYLHPKGLRKKERNEYINRVTKLGRTLKQYFSQRKSPLPKIFVGLNLTSNFRTNSVRNPARNIFGTRYTKIPSPFDLDHFWCPEVIDVFASFAQHFKKEIPIDGIFFDFEMYHAQDQTGQYTDLMDFSDPTWHRYCQATGDTKAQKCKRHTHRIAYLQKEKKFNHYFTVLEQEAKKLGQFLKHELKKAVPNLLFGAYAPSLPLSWFYRGIEAGLSSPSEPLLLATFNTDYASHDQYLKKHDMYVLHGTALMLSKLQTPKDFSQIPALLEQHDFIWYNHPSRMVYEYNQKELDQVWWGIEATPLPPAITMKEISKKHRLTAKQKRTQQRKLS